MCDICRFSAISENPQQSYTSLFYAAPESSSKFSIPTGAAICLYCFPPVIKVQETKRPKLKSCLASF